MPSCSTDANEWSAADGTVETVGCNTSTSLTNNRQKNTLTNEQTHKHTSERTHKHTQPDHTALMPQCRGGGRLAARRNSPPGTHTLPCTHRVLTPCHVLTGYSRRSAGVPTELADDRCPVGLDLPSVGTHAGTCRRAWVRACACVCVCSCLSGCARACVYGCVCVCAHPSCNE
jgi:hypothetical protein